MTARPPHWPVDVEPLDIESFGKLGINAGNELFWDGKRLATRRQFYLTAPQAALAMLAAVASVATAATGLNNASVFLCARNLHWLSCPAPPAEMPSPKP